LMTLTYDGSYVKVYQNGTLQYTHANTRSISYDSAPFALGASNTNSGGFQEYLNGMLDEVRLSNVARSADWIAAEYSNQNSPSTFFSIGAATVNGAGGTAGPYIAALSPTSGPVGKLVTLLGVNFGASQGTSTVTFNAVAATPTNWTDSSIQVLVPAGAATGNIVATVSGVVSNAVSFTVTPPPTAGYAFQRAITMDHTKVPNTDQANFPLLISGTYPFLANVAKGGNVTNANGYDIVFASDAGGVNLLPFEQESYSAASGSVTYWVGLPNLSHTADTTIYAFYGNGSIATDQSNKTIQATTCCPFLCL
jgi:hypothetical protein